MSERRITIELWKRTFVITLNSFLFGYVYVCFNACLVTGSENSSSGCFHGTDDGEISCPPGSIFHDLNLSVVETSLVVSLMLVGAWFGSAVGSIPAEKYGRRVTLLSNLGPFIAGTILTASGNFYCLFIGRFLSGIGVGVVSVSAPMLLSEIANAECRGIVTTMHQVMVLLGILVSSLVAYGFVENIKSGWKYVQLLVALLVIILQHYLPESPKWLVRNNREPEAMSLVKRLRPKHYDVESEFQVLNVELRESSELVATWEEVFACREAVIAGCGLMAFYSFTGINTVSLYSTTIFGLAGFNDSILGTISVNVLGLLSTCLAAYLADRMERTLLLIRGLCGMVAALTILSSVLYWGDDLGEKAQGLIAVLSVLLYMLSFCVGMGSVVWVMMADFTPNKLRSKAMSLYLNVNWACNVVIGMSTLPLINTLGNVHVSDDDGAHSSQADSEEKKGVALLYFIFLAFTVLCIAFVHLLVPKSREVSRKLSAKLIDSTVDNHMHGLLNSKY